MPLQLQLLVIEDVAEDFELIATQLARSGFDARCARVDSATDLCEALSRQSWDVILTDYTMPSLTVPQVLRLVRTRAPTVPCILVSGTASDESARATLRMGMADFVEKDNLEALEPVILRSLDHVGKGAHPGVGPRLRLANGQELQIVEWSTDRRLLDGSQPLRPGCVRDGLFLDGEDATNVRMRVLRCEVHAISSCSIVYRTRVSLA